MNILYVAPYRTDSDYGTEAQSHLQNLLSSQHNITARPIYLDTKTPSILSDPMSCETKIYDSYDVLIQGGPIDWLQHHPGFKTNIAIPMTDSNLILKNHQTKKLNKFNKILVTNSFDEAKLVRSGIDNITKISYPIIYDFIDNIKDQKINLGIHNQSIKYYFFGNIRNDAEIIQKIVVSFYASFRGEYGKSLILLLDNTSDSEKQQFMQIIESIKKELHIFSYQKNVAIYVMFKNLQFQEKLIMHNTCDVFLSLNTNSRSILHESYAKLMNNTVLNIEEIDTVAVPKSDPGNFGTEERVESIITESLINSMKQASTIQPKTKKYDNPKMNKNHIIDIL
jgi:hypothetical protein